MPDKTFHILVYDSGAGGLSICREIIAASPCISLHYLSDNAAFPYGDKSETFIVERVNQVLKHALNAIPADMIVIACNTASTVVLPVLRSWLTIPVVGVVPAIKTAAAITQTGVFGLLATPGTVAREYTQQLIDRFAPTHTVVKVGSSELVQLIEDSISTGTDHSEAIAAVINTFDQHPRASEIDTIVLGCTHFPLIKDVFLSLRPHWQWIDSGQAIAERVLSLLSIKKDSTTAKAVNGRQYAYLTKEDIADRFVEFLAQEGFTRPELISAEFDG